MAAGSEPSESVQSPGGSATVPRSRPALVTCTPAGVPTSTQAVQRRAAGSGRSGTVDSSRPAEPGRGAADGRGELHGWYGIAGAHGGPSAGVQE